MFVRDSGPFHSPTMLREGFRRKYPIYSDKAVREAVEALEEQASALSCGYRIGPFVVDANKGNGITPAAEEFLEHVHPDEYTDAKLYLSDAAVSILFDKLSQVHTADDKGSIRIVISDNPHSILCLFENAEGILPVSDEPYHLVSPSFTITNRQSSTVFFQYRRAISSFSATAFFSSSPSLVTSMAMTRPLSTDTRKSTTHSVVR